MYKSIGQAIIQTLNFLLKNPTGKAIFYNSSRLLAKQENQDRIREATRETIEFVSEHFEEFITSIRKKIIAREKEAQFIIDESKKYSVGQAENSIIVQGENIYFPVIVNNNLITIKNDENSIHDLEQKLNKLKSTERNITDIIFNKQMGDNDTLQEDISNLRQEIDELSDSVKKSISNLTDYSTLQKALDTE